MNCLHMYVLSHSTLRGSTTGPYVSGSDCSADTPTASGDMPTARLKLVRLSSTGPGATGYSDQ